MDYLLLVLMAKQCLSALQGAATFYSQKKLVFWSWQRRLYFGYWLAASILWVASAAALLLERKPLASRIAAFIIAGLTLVPCHWQILNRNKWLKWTRNCALLTLAALIYFAAH